LWLAQISAYCEAAAKYENLKTVDSEIFFSDPEPVLAKTFELFNHEINEQEIHSIVKGHLFTHYSKDPRYEYSNERRITERQVLKQSIASELEEGRDWVTRLGNGTNGQNLFTGYIVESAFRKSPPVACLKSYIF